MDSQFAAILGELGIGMLSNSLYDALKTLVSQQASKEDCTKAIQDCIDVHGVSMRAETVISALADHGLLSISGSDLVANEALLFGSQGGSARITDSTLKTPRSEIQVGVSADNEVGRSATSSLAGGVSAGDPGADAQGPGDAGTTDKPPTQFVHDETTRRQQPGGCCRGGGHLSAQCSPD